MGNQPSRIRRMGVRPPRTKVRWDGSRQRRLLSSFTRVNIDHRLRV
ncbi:hypothetical protein ATSB10_21440 [Dyella thiooxydans]|uniref:Uncharacterized protein n=1 Tax=Dyella thiooxydans TaxID=445710 RepID=A0A160N2H0_9GAMM|nr:hypothetical protein ATSB10_21440 [Dyella thiooxydans]